MPFHSQTSSLRSRVTPGRLVDDRGARSGQPVDERRLADVREADDRDRARELAARLVSSRQARLAGARTSSSIRADDVVDLEVRRVDPLGVLGGLHPRGVALVAHPQVGRERVGADLGPLGDAAPRAHVAVGDEVDLDLGVGRDDGADVAALDHRVALVGELALALAHDLAHLRVPRDDRHDAGRRASCGSRRSRRCRRSKTRPSPSKVTGFSLGELARARARRRAAARAAARARSARGTSRPVSR